MGSPRRGEAYENIQPAKKPKKLSSPRSRRSRNLAAKMMSMSKNKTVGRKNAKARIDRPDEWMYRWRSFEEMTEVKRMEKGNDAVVVAENMAASNMKTSKTEMK